MDEPIVFFGSGPVAKASLKFILERFAVEAVITKPATQQEMEQISGSTPVYTAQNAAVLDELIAKHNFQSRLGILVDFGVIVSKKTINSFELGIVNSHFSLLPQLRGADPITFAILEGRAKTGVSLMLLDEKMDTGKLITQKTLHIGPKATTPSLTKELIELSNSLLADYLPRYISGEIKAHNQPHPIRATYTRKLAKTDGVIGWTKLAEQIEREVRAFLGWPGSRTTIAGKDVIIVKARAESLPTGQAGGEPAYRTGRRRADVGTSFITPEKEIAIQTGKGLLVIERIKPAGKNEMAAAEFLRGYRI